MRASCFLPALLTGLMIIVAPAAAQEPTPQAPVMFVGDKFRFVEGSWAQYTVTEVKSNTQYKVWFAITERLTQKDKPLARMEIAIEKPGQPRVVTSILTEETPKGPGELLEVVVQMDGYGAFLVPKRYLKTDKQQGAQMQPITVVEAKAERTTVTIQGRQLEAIAVQATDSKGRKIKATVSEQVPPLALVSAETDDVRMQLDSWGMDAKTRIDSKPTNMCCWMFSLTWKPVPNSAP